MACNGCGGASFAPSSIFTINSRRRNIMSEQETVKLIFTRKRKGAVRYRGESGQIYLGADTDQHRTVEVRKVDAPKLLGTGHWRLDSLPKQSAELLPDLSEVAVEEVPAFVLAYFTKKSPAWQLVIEAFVQQEREAKNRADVVAVLEAALALIEKGKR